MPQKSSIPIHLFTTTELNIWLKKQPAQVKNWVAENGFEAAHGTHCIIAGANGKIACVLMGSALPYSLWTLAPLATKLPAGNYHLEMKVDKKDATQMLLGWHLATYQFTRYKTSKKIYPTLTIQSADVKYAKQAADAATLTRNLINTPANDMGPSHLADAASKVAKTYKAPCKIIAGEDLLKHNYPTIHMVGRAATNVPRLIDFTWGNPKHPKVTLVGKGVCFDSGGLDLKTAAGMKLMKKDMGGAAAVLGLAQLIMEYKLPVRLRVLIPAVENSVAGNAFRPMDIVKTRKGNTVEIGNTDAEGRLILCDALTEADSEKPDLIIDCATLTGAARVALGTDIPAVFSNNDALAGALIKHAKIEEDPLWQLPLWNGYRDKLNSPIADLNNAPEDGGYAGAITAALFLEAFIAHCKNWIHIDMMAWNVSTRAGRPQGGEAMGVRACFALIRERYEA